jgi:hypothetical protein
MHKKAPIETLLVAGKKIVYLKFLEKVLSQNAKNMLF